MGGRAAGLIVLTAVVGGASAEVRWIERPDDMAVLTVNDFDRLGDRVRILYSTMPSLQQGQADPEGWRSNVYLVEAHADGAVDQRRLASYHGYFTKLLLRRGHDEVLVVRRPEKQGGPQNLEAWSARDGSVRSSVAAPVLPESNSARPADLTYAAPTSDGNLFVVTQFSHGPGNGIHWYKLSPEGKVLGQGTYTLAGARINAAGRFAAHGGGVGLTVRLRITRGSEGLTTDIETPVERTVGGRTIEARVASETRMLISDGQGQRLWVSPALERQLMWGGQMQIADDLPGQERMRQLREQMRMTEETELELGARRTLLGIGGGVGVRRVPGGYGVLARVTANRRRKPPAHGPYYLEIGDDGTLQREVYLGPVAEALDAKLADLVADGDGGLLLAGSRRVKQPRGHKTHVTRVTVAGELDWTALLEAPPRTLAGIARAGSASWVFGHALHKPAAKTLLWLEQAEAPPAGANAGAPVAPDRQTPGAPPRASTEPSRQGCACTCEEFQEIRRLARQMQGQPDPGTMQKLLCAQQCAAQYRNCITR